MSGTKLIAVDPLAHLLRAKLPHPGRLEFPPFYRWSYREAIGYVLWVQGHRLWEAELQHEPKFMSN